MSVQVPRGLGIERIAVAGVLALTVITIFFALRAAHGSGPVYKPADPTVAAAKPDPATVAHRQGRELFTECAVCHGKKAEGDKKQNAPALSLQEDWYIVRQLQKFKEGVRGTDPKDIGGVQMQPRAMALADADMQVVADYIVSLADGGVQPPPRTVDGDAGRGKALFAICAACHGMDGSGNPVLNAPSLTGQHDWYLVAQLMNFRTGLRGAHPKDITGAAMVPMALALGDPQAVNDVAAYIVTLPITRPQAAPDAAATAVEAASTPPPATVAPPPEPELDAELVAQGKTLFQTKICFTCHQIDPKVPSPAGTALKAPGFIGQFWGIEREVQVGINGPVEKVVMNEEYFMESVEKPMAKIVKGAVPGMAPLPTTLDERKALMAYVKSLSAEP